MNLPHNSKEQYLLLLAIFEKNPYPIWISDQHGTLIQINQACCELIGVQPEEVIGQYNVLQDNIVREQGYLPLLESVYQEGKTVQFCLEYDTPRLKSLSLKKSKAVTIEATISALTDAQGNIVNAIFIHRNITQQNILEKELKLFRHIVESSSDAVFWIKKSGQFNYVNEQACRSLGYTREELLTLHLWDIDPHYPKERWPSAWEETKKTERRSLETEHQRKDGSSFPIEVSAHHITLNNMEYHVAFTRDITQRKQAEAQLEEREQQLKEAQHMAQLGYWKWDIKSGAVEWSDETYRIFRRDPEEFTPQIDTIMALSPWPEDHQRDQEIIREALANREQGSYEQRFLRPDGSSGYYFSTFRGIFDAENNLVTLLGTIQDITERKLAEEALRASEGKYRSLIDNLRIGITLIGPNMEVLSVNNEIRSRYPDVDFSTQPTCYQTFNYPPQQKPCSYCAAVKTFQDGEVHETVTNTPSKEGTKHYRVITSPIKNDSGKVTSVIEMVEDITDKMQFEKEKEKLEQQLHQAQKMEAVGTLAGGVAHDFNNMLSVIIGYSGLLKTKLPTDSSLLRYVSEIEQAALRSRDTTRQLLGFSRQQAIAPRPINLLSHIRQLKMTFARLIGEDIAIQIQADKTLWDIHFDPSQIDQILFNLAVNARDAMPNGGKLSIEAENVTLDETYCQSHLETSPGDYVLLKVTDNGEGMDRETLAHAFDPFFTTKEIGKGTGLGLATVYGIIKQNKGYISIGSEPGQGTNFNIYIPKGVSTAGEQRTRKQSAVHLPAPVAVTGTILLVEDDKMVRAMTQKILEESGYTVLLAEDPVLALTICKEHRDRIDLLLTDVIMPNMNGAELRNEVLKINPGIKILFMSGYTASVISRHGVLDEDVNFIHKPFEKNELVKKIQAVLRQP